MHSPSVRKANENMSGALPRIRSVFWLGFPGQNGKDEMQVIRETEKAFTMQDLMRLACYIDDGRRTEGTLRHVLSCWLQGPEGNKRVKVINDSGEVVHSY